MELRPEGHALPCLSYRVRRLQSPLGKRHLARCHQREGASCTPSEHMGHRVIPCSRMGFACSRAMAVGLGGVRRVASPLW